MTVTGNFGDIQIGASYEFKGQLKEHPATVCSLWQQIIIDKQLVQYQA